MASNYYIRMLIVKHM